MSYPQQREAAKAARRSLAREPLRPDELSPGAVRDQHVSERIVGEMHLSPALLIEALAARPPSEGSVGSAHLSAELAGRVGTLEGQVRELTNEVSYLRGVLAGKDLL